MQSQVLTTGYPEERAGYFQVSGAHLYTVLHEVQEPVARVLLVGPFASERHNSYLPWMRWVGLEQILKFGADQRSASDYIRELEQGSVLEVDGYNWSPALWRESFQYSLPAGLLTQESADRAYKRPARIVKLTREAAPLTKGGIVGYDDLKDFSWLFAPNREWIASMSSSWSEGVAYV